jgi:hypothetical protein
VLAETLQSITLSAVFVTMIVSFFIPAVVALITKSAASAWLKQFVTGLLAAVSGLVTTAMTLDGTAVLSRDMILLTAGAFILAQANYVTLYKPHAANAKIAPEVGIG